MYKRANKQIDGMQSTKRQQPVDRRRIVKTNSLGAQIAFDEAEQGTGSNRPQNGKEEDEEDEEDDSEDPASIPQQVHPGDACTRCYPHPSSSSPPVAQTYLPLPPTIIFCNTVSCCRAIAWFLTAKGLHVGHYHGLMPVQYRTTHFTNFLSGVTNILGSD